MTANDEVKIKYCKREEMKAKSLRLTRGAEKLGPGLDPSVWKVIGSGVVGVYRAQLHQVWDILL